MASYEEVQNRTYKLTDQEERILLANFTARITKETRIVDGINSETFLTIQGLAHDPERPKQPTILPEVEIQATQYAALQWVLSAWGVRAIIQPGSGVKDDLRTAIQMASKPETKTIYRAIGWTTIGKERAYLHARGAITHKGNDDSVTTRLPPELAKYDLSGSGDPKAAFLASLHLTSLAPPNVAWTLWTATFAPLFGAIDFATHLTGRSGTFKSELVSLFQSHYGAGMDSRHLPGSWSSTPNALEAQAFHAANAVFVIDDFVPVGTSWQVRAYQTAADKIIRAQGNQAGRARLTDTSGLQTTFYPRGLIMSTGEDTPEGHSVRARMMIVELSPGDIATDKLTVCQNNREKYPLITANLIRHLCTNQQDLTVRTNQLRNKNIQIGHTRTPPMMGRLIATGEAVLEWACKNKWISNQELEMLIRSMTEALMTAGNNQSRYLEQADPVEIFLAGLRQLLGAGQAHIRTLNGGIPFQATSLGWISEQSTSDIPTFKSRGPCIGWIDWNDDSIYLEANNAYSSIKKLIGQELALTKQTIFKRLKDAGLLLRVDESRQRNTIRVTAEGHPRQVLALSASGTMEQAEVPSEDENDKLQPPPCPFK